MPDKDDRNIVHQNTLGYRTDAVYLYFLEIKSKISVKKLTNSK
jgi:hypothetical protein